MVRARLGSWWLAALSTLVLGTEPAHAVNNEPPQCLSPDPRQWPAASKPYFMLAVDTSLSAALPVPLQTCATNAECTATGGPAVCNCILGGTAPACTGNVGYCAGVAPTCAGYPSNRGGYARCALQNAIKSAGGQANFGLAGFSLQQSACSPAATCSTTTCFTGCTYTAAPGDLNPTAPTFGCGPGIASTRRGANILVPLLQDNFWSAPPSPSNVPALLQNMDNSATSDRELWAQGKVPLNGMLRDLQRYFAGTYVNPVNSVALPSPLDPTNERACRQVNIILVVSGDENCDTYADAVAAATALYNGVTVGSVTWNIRTHVVAVAGGANSAQVAGTGATSTQLGTTAGHGYFMSVSTSAAVNQAVLDIVTRSLKPETCDNVDNNCNGCTDEGSAHHCNVNQACCSLPRTSCLASYMASITAANPSGNLALLPCTDVPSGTTPSTWLCQDPGDTCDNTDNNCNGQVDERKVKCGSPAHCPQAETCNGQDDDCDGLVDNGPFGGSVCPGTCVPTPEVCDGCDNDCDGIVDNSVPNTACGLAANPPFTPAYCAGTLACTPRPAPTPGACLPGGGQSTCSATLQPETCNGVDDNCNGVPDDNIASAPCIPVGAPSGLVYSDTNANSRCHKGQTVCINGAIQCVGWSGPSAEVCDGVDNNCDGQVDNGVPGVNQPCGVTVGECRAGATACVNGALACSGGVGPRPEVCDGKDNDCNGNIDDGTLVGAPSTAQQGCWSFPGNCCVFADAQTGRITQWCPPPGATCNALGSLSSPCNAGNLVCGGTLGWTCQAVTNPSPETCNGRDDDCNGAMDDGVLPAPIGQPCGSTVGECLPGTQACVNGQPVCNGTGPLVETCDGKDNDCDGVDDNVHNLGPCTVPYDVTVFPGARTSGACRQGVEQCSASALTCTGVGPQPEVCDGVDNDCDGQVDEAGVAPDGVGGSVDPLHANNVVGEACGSGTGACLPGTWACSLGSVVCSGGVRAAPERCDGEDNDCDGITDNENAPGGPLLCPSGSECVRSSTGTHCAPPCGPSLPPCPTGQPCVPADLSSTGAAVGLHCGVPAFTVVGAVPQGSALDKARKGLGGCSCATGNGNLPFHAAAGLAVLLVMGRRRKTPVARGEGVQP